MLVMDEGINRLNLLAPGLRFSPTDEEIVLHFLYHKATSHHNFSNSSFIIPQLQLHLYNPWQFHGKTLTNGDNIHYFFNKVGESRETKNGYWKDVLMDEPIFCTVNGNEIGIKKYFIFLINNIGEEFEEEEDEIQTTTTWVMQEYHINPYLFNNIHPQSQQNNNLSQTKPEFGSWVLCRVFEAKDNSGRNMYIYEEDDDNESELSYLDEMYLTLDDI